MGIVSSIAKFFSETRPVQGGPLLLDDSYLEELLYWGTIADIPALVAVIRAQREEIQRLKDVAPSSLAPELNAPSVTSPELPSPVYTVAALELGGISKWSVEDTASGRTIALVQSEQSAEAVTRLLSVETLKPVTSTKYVTNADFLLAVTELVTEFRPVATLPEIELWFEVSGLEWKNLETGEDLLASLEAELVEKQVLVKWKNEDVPGWSFPVFKLAEGWAARNGWTREPSTPKV